MFANLALGTFIIATTVGFHTLGLVLLSRWLSWVVRWFRLHRHSLGKTVAMMTTVLGIFLLHTLEVWFWAFTFMVTGAIHGFEAALYFSTVTFSTLGYGDITPSQDWRLLAALEGIDGFLLIGWSTAYLIAASTRHGPFRSGEDF